MSKNLTLPRQAIKKEGLVILPLKEYKKMWDKIEKLAEEKKASIEEIKILEIIAEGESEYREGKTIRANSLKEAFKIYQSKT